MVDREQILSFLQQRSRRPVSFRELLQGLRLSRSDNRRLKQSLRELVRDGKVLRTKRGLYGPAPSMNMIQGRFEAHGDGYGFLIPDEAGRPDHFIAARNTLGAMGGDQVLARVERPERREAAVVKILARRSKRFVGRLEGTARNAWVTPRNKRGGMDLLIPEVPPGLAAPGDWVVAEILKYPEFGRPPEGRIMKNLGPVKTPADDISIIIEEYGLPRRFPSPAKKEAAAVSPEFTNAVFTGRKDLRILLTVTIDGERARDFDDAISIRTRPDRGYTLWVHIADVSHYVRPGSALDTEARRRGTSVYFPDRVLPMLPPELSSDLCSLKPGLDRLSISVEMDFDDSGHRTRADFMPSVINSNQRLTYTEAARVIEHPDDPEHKANDVAAALLQMQRLALLLKQKRRDRGSLDFDLPEPEILLDLEGKPEDIVVAARNDAHRLIEEFMLAANEAVAENLDRPELQTVFRIHEEPDPEQIAVALKLLKEAGLRVRRKALSSRNLAQILEETEGLPSGRVLHYHILRALKTARYSPENRGHFGLASSCYTHFTSPIRRYPDLLVHRVLKSVLSRSKGESGESMTDEDFRNLCLHCSQTERNADKAERDSANSLRAWFMKEKVGEEFDGYVEDVKSAGVRVRLKAFFVDGFIPVSALTDDYYLFHEASMMLTGRHTGRRFKLGQEIRVLVVRVNIEDRSIIFGPVSSPVT